MPDKEEIHVTLPTRFSVWLIYQKDAEMNPEKYVKCSYAHFNSVWHDQLCHIKLLRYNRFPLCDVCTQMRRDRDDNRDPVKERRLRTKIEDHIRFVKQERVSITGGRSKPFQNRMSVSAWVAMGRIRRSLTCPISSNCRT